MPFAKDETLLIFRIADIPFAVPAQSVGSILMPPEHITHTPGSARSTPGIFHHAQFTYAVIDLHTRFGIDTARIGVGRLLLQDEGMRHYAFLVDRVVGLVRSEQGKWANLPHYLPRELFSAGFLYQDEIVLCTELPLLRNMHDVEPLRHHFAQLQQQQKKMTNEENPPTAEKPTENPVPATIHVESATRKSTEQKPVKTDIAPPSVEEKQETKTIVPERKVPTPVPSPSPSPVVPEQKKPTPTPAAKPTPLLSPEKTAAAKTAQSFATSAEEVPRSRAETLHAPPPPTHPAATAQREVAYEEKDNSLLWLILFLLLLSVLPIGYWLWPQTEPPHMNPPVAKISPPRVQPAIEEPPLRIERDEDGTINLIIDRQAAAKAAPALAEKQATTPVDSVTEQVMDGKQQTVPAKTSGETSVIDTAAPFEEKPATVETTQPEPCDCTHIVVKGDTLWDIAKLYTGNAFNYHELAKRSRIKNPDRIYPGDKVRIIIR